MVANQQQKHACVPFGRTTFHQSTKHFITLERTDRAQARKGAKERERERERERDRYCFRVRAPVEVRVSSSVCRCAECCTQDEPSPDKRAWHSTQLSTHGEMRVDTPHIPGNERIELLFDKCVSTGRVLQGSLFYCKFEVFSARTAVPYVVNRCRELLIHRGVPSLLWGGSFFDRCSIFKRHHPYMSGGGRDTPPSKHPICGENPSNPQQTTTR